MTNKRVEIYLVFSAFLIISCNMNSSGNLEKSKHPIQERKSLTITDSIINSLSGIPELPVIKVDSIDLNYDGYKDLIILQELTGSSGFLCRAKIFVFDSIARKFQSDDVLNNIENPSFFVERNLITGFYIGSGGGYGLKYQWKSNKWDTLEYMTFEPDLMESSKWKISVINYGPTKKRIIKKSDNFMIPDTNVLLNNW